MLHHIIILTLLTLGFPAFAAGPAVAEPEAPAEEENPDAELVESLLGKSYSGDLPIEGWNNLGGGLVAPPIYVHLYRREDGTSLVLTSRLSSRTYEVTDALMISKPWKGYTVSIACTRGKDFTLRFIGDARGPEAKEWWTEVRRAWEIALKPEPQPEPEAGAEAKPETKPDTAAEAEAAPDPGKIKKANTRGVKCTNPNW
jgi:hypothetical protein